MKHFIILFLLFINFAAFSQLKQNIADNHFNRMEYSKCVEMYNEMAYKTIAGKADKIENISKAAISNYKLYQIKKAIHYFKILDQRSKLKEKDGEYYIQALRFIGKYKQAEEIVRKLQNQYPENEYFNQLYNELGQFNALFKDSADRKVSPTNISSVYGDFGPTYYQNGLVYATQSKNTQVLNGRSKRDNSFYMSLMKSPFNADSTIDNGKLLRHKFLDQGNNGPVDFSYDEQNMVITKNELEKSKGTGIPHLGLYFSSKQENGKWSDLVPFEYNDSEYNFGHGCFADDGKTLYFISDMPGGFGGPDIYRSNWVDGKWLKPENLGSKINTSMKEMFPFVSGDTLYFTSDGHFGLGGMDLFQVELTGQKEPDNLGFPINTSTDDFGLICQRGGRLGFFSSNRKDTLKEENIDQIYSFKRPVLKHDLIINLYAKYGSAELTANQLVYLKNAKTGEKKEYLTDDNSQIHLSLGEDKTYIGSISKEDYILSKKNTLSTVGLSKGEGLTVDLVLLPIKIGIDLRVIDEDTQLPLDSATINISDHLANRDFNKILVTNAQGIAKITVDRNNDFLVHGSKKDYLDKEMSFNLSNEDGKNIELEFKLSSISEGMAFKSDNIFYDFDRSTLRSKSMKTLDKLAQFLTENDVKVEFSAYTDTRGNDNYNQKLSQLRAQSCVDYLVQEKGIDPKRIIAKGYGEKRPAQAKYNGKTVLLDDAFFNGLTKKKNQEKYYQLNRRTEMKILEYNKN